MSLHSTGATSALRHDTAQSVPRLFTTGMNRRHFTRLMPALPVGALAAVQSWVQRLQGTPIGPSGPVIGPSAPEWVLRVANHPMVRPLASNTVPNKLTAHIDQAISRRSMEVGVEHVTRLVSNEHGFGWLELQQVTGNAVQILETWGL